MWDQAIHDWGFVSNILAELIGVFVLGVLLALAVRIWTSRQRRTPKSLAVRRLQSFGLHVIQQAAGALGYGFVADRKDWSWTGAVEYLTPLLEPGIEGQQRRKGIDREEWLWLAKTIVREFDRLDARLQSYQFIFAENKRIFERYALLDADIDAVGAALEVLEDPQHQVSGLLEALQGMLPSRVFPCVIGAVLLVGVTQDIKIKRVRSDDEGIRSTAAYVSQMEQKYQEYLRSHVTDREHSSTKPKDPQR